MMNPFKPVRIRPLHAGLGFLLLLLFVQNGSAQVTARSLGMGQAYTALARGAHAPLYNPANLGLPGNPRFSMTLFSVGIGGRNNSFNKSDYDYYLVEHPEWDSNDVEAILGRIPDEGFQFHMRGTARLLSFSAGRFAMSFGVEAGSYFQADRELFELSLLGNELDRTYSFDRMYGESAGVGLLSLSWGEPVRVSFAEAFSIGTSLNMLYGIGFANVEHAAGSITTRPWGFEVAGDYQTALFTGNLGLNLDVGAAARFGKQWTVSLALANVAGTLNWSRDETTRGYVRGDSLTAYQIADQEEEAVEDSSWTWQGGRSFERRLPLVFRLGSAYQIRRLTFTADFVQSFTNDSWVTRKPQFCLGMEWRALPWFYGRTGLAAGGKLGFGTSIGVGICPGGFVFDLAVMNGGFIAPGSAKGYVFALEMAIQLN